MSSVAKQNNSALLNEITELKKENAYLRRELLKQKSHIKELEDVSLTLAERQILIGKKTIQTLN